MTKKNRKARRLQELYPEVKIRVFYQRDYLSLLMKYGLEPPSQLVVNGEPPFWLSDPRQSEPRSGEVVPRRRREDDAAGDDSGVGRRPKRRPKSA